MRVPRFWAVVEGSGAGPQGERLFRRMWGWSMSSAAEALAMAQERLRDALAGIRFGTKVGSYYPRVPLREPILDELIVDGEQVLVLTRNRYGAEILNTDRVVIADIDLPELEGQTLRGLLRRVFRRTPAAAGPSPEPPVVVENRGTIAEWAAAHPGLGVVVYRTASGMRVFVTGVDEPAPSAQGEQILAELGADPIYRELCRTHGTYRARLTPKPWRLPGIRGRGESWPYADDSAVLRFERWLAGYNAAAVGYAVCRRLATHGPGPSTLEAQIIQLHDERTRVSNELPLA